MANSEKTLSYSLGHAGDYVAIRLDYDKAVIFW
ncbi:hypothetical protein CBM2637_B110144 [Cupriavidus taiwanensis]|nr:hypothetical protein CBM2637_B110144 [Cupriavidus taiwanensis]